MTSSLSSFTPSDKGHDLIIKHLLKDFKRPGKVEFSAKQDDPLYGQFIAEPFERGFGVTVGNSLRRAMLSSLWGAAITAVKFDGVVHEFSTIDGVVEDTTEIILNLKRVRLKKTSIEPKTIMITKKGPGTITAGDLNVDADIEIINTDLVLVNISKAVEVGMTVEVQYGRGYVPSEMFKDSVDEVGVISMDAAFSPVVKVNLQVDNTRVGQRTDYEKITLDVWTDGSVRPADAVSQAAKILKEHYTMFISFDDSEVQEEYPDEKEKRELVKVLEKPIEILELSVRSINCMKAIKIEVLGDLVTKSEADILRTRNFGKKSLTEIREKLQKYGLSLGMKKVPAYTRPKPDEEDQ